MQNIMPLTIKKYDDLNDEQIMIIDQFLFRFAKLQDVIGSRLFVNMLLFLNEDVKSLTMIDKLNKLEKLNLIESKLVWQNLRDVRNNVSHNYEQDNELSIEFINKIYQEKDNLIGFYLKINQYYEDKFPK